MTYQQGAYSEPKREIIINKKRPRDEAKNLLAQEKGTSSESTAIQNVDNRHGLEHDCLV